MKLRKLAPDTCKAYRLSGNDIIGSSATPQLGFHPITPHMIRFYNPLIKLSGVSTSTPGKKLKPSLNERGC